MGSGGRIEASISDERGQISRTVKHCKCDSVRTAYEKNTRIRAPTNAPYIKSRHTEPEGWDGVAWHDPSSSLVGVPDSATTWGVLHFSILRGEFPHISRADLLLATRLPMLLP
ncbi:unnamed protein product [Ectocarpus sp. 12 AP-2014]